MKTRRLSIVVFLLIATLVLSFLPVVPVMAAEPVDALGLYLIPAASFKAIVPVFQIFEAALVTLVAIAVVDFILVRIDAGLGPGPPQCFAWFNSLARAFSIIAAIVLKAEKNFQRYNDNISSHFNCKSLLSQGARLNVYVITKT